LTCLPGTVERFEQRLREHARHSREHETGCLKFDIFQSKEDPCVFLLSEEYSDEDAWQSHRSSEHVRRFRADSADWVAQRQWWFWRTANEG
jgi:quinol monooxygenase YgiN